MVVPLKPATPEGVFVVLWCALSVGFSRFPLKLYYVMMKTCESVSVCDGCAAKNSNPGARLPGLTPSFNSVLAVRPEKLPNPSQNASAPKCGT